MRAEVEIARDLTTQVRNVQDAALLWTEWAYEQGYDDPDTEAYLADIIDKVRGGTYSVFIARVDDEPVGMVDVSVQYEPGDRSLVAFIDKLYVKPEYRGGRTAYELTDAVRTAARLMGVTSALISVKTDGPRRFYAKHGFVDHMILMKYEE